MIRQAGAFISNRRHDDLSPEPTAGFSLRLQKREAI